VLSVVDYLAPPSLLSSLFTQIARVARARRACAVCCLTLHERAARALRLAGFVRVRRDSPDATRFMVSASPRVDHALVGRREHWFITGADSDVDHEDHGSLP
jgi:hypothetical protein